MTIRYPLMKINSISHISPGMLNVVVLRRVKRGLREQDSCCFPQKRREEDISRRQLTAVQCLQALALPMLHSIFFRVAFRMAKRSPSLNLESRNPVGAVACEARSSALSTD